MGPRVIGPAQLRIAQAALLEAAALLEIEPPALRWFDVEGDGERAYVERYGWRDWEWFPGDPRLMGLYVAPLNEVWIRRGLSAEETARTVAHEVRHAVDHGERRAEREAAAESFSAAIVAVIGA